jgi:uncharacterized protein YndB with AHSA1/START domain
MQKRSEISSEAVRSEFIFTRVVNAPLDLVWKAHTESKHMSQWWGPKGFKTIKSKMDFRPGGMFLYGMEGPNGMMMWGRMVYREIVPHEKLVVVVSFSNEAGDITAQPFSNDKWPLEMLNTITFEEHNGKTTVTVTGSPINATDEECKVYLDNYGNMQHGFGATYDKLDEYLVKI